MFILMILLLLSERKSVNFPPYMSLISETTSGGRDSKTETSRS